MRHLVRFGKALIWHWHNAISLGVVGLATWIFLGQPSVKSVAVVLGIAFVLAVTRLAWVEFWRNRGLALKIERVFIGSRIEGAVGTPIMIFGKVSNLSGLADQGDGWRLSYRLPNTRLELETTQHTNRKDIPWGNGAITANERLDIRAFQSISPRSAVRGYLVFLCRLSTTKAEMLKGTRVTLSFHDLAGDRVSHSVKLKDDINVKFDKPLGM